jgi:peptidoglycan hydrolase-like protein with peptidoglycan-binding domain
MKKIVAIVLVLVMVLSIAVASAGTALRLGSKGSSVRRLQAALRRYGYSDVVVDGTFGEATKAAVINFQRKNGLNPDGVAGNMTLQALGIYVDPVTSTVLGFAQQDKTVEQHTGLEEGYENTFSDYNPDYEIDLNNTLKRQDGLTIGSTGPVVRKVQTYLRKLGWTSVKVDGKYGAKTAACVKEFQKNNGLQVDGIAGIATQNVLFSGSAIGRRTENSLPTLRRGDSDATKNNWVSRVQNYLTSHNDPNTSAPYLASSYATGYYNVQTQNAVAAFQADSGLTVDGVAGRKTLMAMGYSGYTYYTDPYLTVPTEPSTVTVTHIDGTHDPLN